MEFWADQNVSTRHPHPLQCAAQWWSSIAFLWHTHHHVASWANWTVSPGIMSRKGREVLPISLWRWLVSFACVCVYMYVCVVQACSGMCVHANMCMFICVSVEKERERYSRDFQIDLCSPPPCPVSYSYCKHFMMRLIFPSRIPKMYPCKYNPIYTYKFNLSANCKFWFLSKINKWARALHLCD